MAIQAYLTTRAILNWRPSLFDNLVVPSGVDRNVLILNILQMSDNLEVLFPEPEFFQSAIGSWSRTYLKNWQDLYDTTVLDYDPIVNYDRTEERSFSDDRWLTEKVDATSSANRNNATEEGGSSKTVTIDSGSVTVSGRDKETVDSNYSSSGSRNETGESASTTSSSSSSTTIDEVSAFNSPSYEPSKKSTTTGEQSSNGSENSTSDISNSERGSTEQTTDRDTSQNTNRNLNSDTNLTRNLTTHSEATDQSTSDTNRNTHDSSKHAESVRAFGNIGVTTTQQMIREQREIVQFNIYDYIARAFVEFFCILVY